MLARPTSVSAQAHLVSLAPNRVAANNDSHQPRVSADGLRVVFSSKASNLVTGDNNGKEDVFLWDGREKPAVIVRISVASGGTEAEGGSQWPSISPAGDYVAFTSNAPNLGGPVGDTLEKVYVRHIGGPRANWTTTWASRPYNGQTPDRYCTKPSMSDVGLVAFECYATNMVANDTNGCLDVFVANVLGGMIRRVNTTTNGEETRHFAPEYPFCYSEFPSISADGTLVAFQSSAKNLVTGDNNKAVDVFVKNLKTTILSWMNGLDNADPKGASQRPAISGDGRFVAFESQATNMADDGNPHGISQVYRVTLDPAALDSVILVIHRVSATEVEHQPRRLEGRVPDRRQGVRVATGGGRYAPQLAGLRHGLGSCA